MGLVPLRRLYYPIIQLFEALRDLVINLLPENLCPKFVQGEFAFLCHPLDVRDVARKYPFASHISEKLFHLWAKFYWPILGAQIIGPRKKNSELSKGWAVISPLPPSMLVRDPEHGRRMVIRATRLCEKLGFKLVALGGYNSIISHDGEDLVEKVRLAVTTGNTYSALLILENIRKVAQDLHVDVKEAKAALVGAVGSVGSACAQILPSLVGELWLMDINRRALRELHSRLNNQHKNVNVFEDISAVKNVDIVITATSTPKAIIYEEHLKPGMILIDAAQPKNVSEDIARSRKDVLVIDSGIAKVPQLSCEMSMGPQKDEVYACLGEALALVCSGQVRNFSIGKVQPEQVGQLSRIVEELGFRVADFRNAAGFITKDQLSDFRDRYIRERYSKIVP